MLSSFGECDLCLIAQGCCLENVSHSWHDIGGFASAKVVGKLTLWRAMRLLSGSRPRTFSSTEVDDVAGG